MEDQQPAAGDLSDADAEPASPPRRDMPRGKARRTPTPAPVDIEPDVADDDAGDAGGAVADDDERTSERRQVVFVERTPPGRRAPIAIGVGAALFVGAGAFAGAMVQPYLADRAAVDTKLEVARTATNAITTLWTYTPEDMEQLADRSTKFLASDFQAEYRKYIDAIVPTNKQAQVTNSTQVVGAAVESLNGPDATAIVYTNSTATSPLSKNIPSLRYLSYRLTLHREGRDWLVTGMSAITNLDLTPQI